MHFLISVYICLASITPCDQAQALFYDHGEGDYPDASICKMWNAGHSVPRITYEGEKLKFAVQCIEGKSV